MPKKTNEHVNPRPIRIRKKNMQKNISEHNMSQILRENTGNVYIYLRRMQRAKQRPKPMKTNILVLILSPGLGPKPKVTSRSVL